MIIQCPKCGFSREVPEDKVPATSNIATCPKCSHKFKFRDISKVTRLRDYREGQDGAAAEPRTVGQQARSGESGISGAQGASGAEVKAGAQPKAEGDAPRTGNAPDQASGQSGRDARARPAKAARPPAEGDIWQRLESMRPGRPEEPGQDDREVPATDGELPQGSPSDEDVARGVSIDAPWERMDKFGFVGGFVQTVKRAMFHPQAFFAYMSLKGMVKPLAFFLLVGFVQLAAQLLWGSAGMTFMDLVSPQQAGPQASTSLGEGGYLILAIFPLILLALLFAISGLNHLFLMATKAANRGFEATFRAVAYGSAPLVLSIIPYAGDMLGLIWNLAVTIIAYRYIHRTSYTRVALAMFIPFAFMFALGLLSLNAK